MSQTREASELNKSVTNAGVISEVVKAAREIPAGVKLPTPDNDSVENC
jgi:hypothetical protein